MEWFFGSDAVLEEDDGGQGGGDDGSEMVGEGRCSVQEGFVGAEDWEKISFSSDVNW